MTARRIIGVAFFLAAAVLAVVATRNTFFSDGLSVTNSSGLGVSAMVGSYLPGFVMLIIGVWLFQKPK